MPEDFQELEAELKNLRPRAVSPELLARLEGDLTPSALRSGRSAYSSATSWRSWKWAVWSAATAAAAAAVVLALVDFRPVSSAHPLIQSGDSGRAPVTAQAADVYKPVSADNVLYSTRDEGAVTLADGTPARQVRSQYVDTITWKNPRTNASLRWSVPRDEVRVVPVSFQ